MKKNIGILLVILLTTSLSFGQAQMSVDSIFSRYYAATGGEALWDGLKSYSMKQSYRSNSSADYDAEVYVSLPEKAMHKSKIILKRNFVYAVKGNEGWLKIPLGSYDKVANYQVKDLSSGEQENMRMEMYDLLVPFINFNDRGYIATFVGQETLNGKKVNQVELQGKGVKYNLYFDDATGLLVREKKALPGEEIVSEYSNYKKCSYGIMYPGTTVETSSKDKKSVTVTSSLTVNEAINPDYFKR
ncbi:hypothetical protein [Telluribacter sp.]|jgi:putative salt-induced outer membrane protein|uniref:hypothetical protein n=1 Tax=Telluribacter sp. TaxID=1978767 RepID=UPI002E142E7A|nr:hypothetical protein [Telluribacter sp.]